MWDMHVYTNKEYEEKKNRIVLKNITKPVYNYCDNKSAIIKNYIYYSQSVKIY